MVKVVRGAKITVINAGLFPCLGIGHYLRELCRSRLHRLFFFNYLIESNTCHIYVLFHTFISKILYIVEQEILFHIEDVCFCHGQYHMQMQKPKNQMCHMTPETKAPKKKCQNNHKTSSSIRKALYIRGNHLRNRPIALNTDQLLLPISSLDTTKVRAPAIVTPEDIFLARTP